MFNGGARCCSKAGIGISHAIATANGLKILGTCCWFPFASGLGWVFELTCFIFTSSTPPRQARIRRPVAKVIGMARQSNVSTTKASRRLLDSHTCLVRQTLIAVLFVVAPTNIVHFLVLAALWDLLTSAFFLVFALVLRSLTEEPMVTRTTAGQTTFRSQIVIGATRTASVFTAKALLTSLWLFHSVGAVESRRSRSKDAIRALGIPRRALAAAIFLAAAQCRTRLLGCHWH